MRGNLLLIICVCQFPCTGCNQACPSFNVTCKRAQKIKRIYILVIVMARCIEIFSGSIFWNCLTRTDRKRWAPQTSSPKNIKRSAAVAPATSWATRRDINSSRGAHLLPCRPNAPSSQCHRARSLGFLAVSPSSRIITYCMAGYHVQISLNQSTYLSKSILP